VQSTDAHDAPDLLIVGAGAAGMATGIFAARRLPAWRIVALDGAARLGAKILVSGGGRCNVTNAVVTAADYNGGSPHIIKRVLAAFGVDATVAFFREIGVELHEEEHGKLFPNTNAARTVVEALVGEARRRGVEIRPRCRVHAIARGPHEFTVQTTQGALRAKRVVLATGGLSLPKTGSDGAGYAFAEALGHTIVPTTPALDPFVLDGELHAPLAGVTHDAALTVHVAGEKPVRRRGSLLWTHFGISGPVALDSARFWNRAVLAGRPARLTLSVLPEDDADRAERRLLGLAASQPRSALHNALATLVPARLAAALLAGAGVDGGITMAQLARDTRRRLSGALLERELPVRGTRGYNYAEVTAGGVPLSEIDAGMQSRKCPGLFLVGEILDVDGRIGGFNFQWAWSGAWVLAGALARLAP
jgi:hypothetical protein